MAWTPLHEAADNDYYDIAKVLLANHANVNIRASKGGRITVIPGRDVRLQRHRATVARPWREPNVKDDNGVTPLHLAAWHGYKKTAKLLLAAGANANMRNKMGESPLDWARERSDKGMIKLLQARGAKQ